MQVTSTCSKVPRKTVFPKEVAHQLRWEVYLLAFYYRPDFFGIDHYIVKYYVIHSRVFYIKRVVPDCTWRSVVLTFVIKHQREIFNRNLWLKMFCSFSQYKHYNSKVRPLSLRDKKWHLNWIFTEIHPGISGFFNCISNAHFQEKRKMQKKIEVYCH